MATEVTSITFSEYPPAPPDSQCPQPPPPPPTTLTITLVHPAGLVHVDAPVAEYTVVANKYPVSELELKAEPWTDPSERVIP